VTVIVDASVALKWVVEEDGAAAAIALIGEELMAAPDLLFVECANVLSRKVRRGQISAMAAGQAQASIEAAPIRVAPAKPHVAAALFIAMELGRSAYDSLYLATAMAERAVMVTADAAFARAALSHPVYASSVRLLGA
jgi:predicted nucleic acid-binding protein